MHKKDIKVFDNQGRTFDRYTVVIGKNVFTMSKNTTSPQGFNQYAGELGKDINLDILQKGELVKYLSLPKDVQKAIQDRLKEELD